MNIFRTMWHLVFLVEWAEKMNYSSFLPLGTPMHETKMCLYVKKNKQILNWWNKLLFSNFFIKTVLHILIVTSLHTKFFNSQIHSHTLYNLTGTYVHNLSRIFRNWQLTWCCSDVPPVCLVTQIVKRSAWLRGILEMFKKRFPMHIFL